ncbi:MAG: ArsA-related P-loop ATPase [Ilumatobacteraceae bacterium]
MATKPFYQIADRVLGSRFLRDIGDFFMLFQAMEKGFVSRAKEVEQLLGDRRTAFVVVSTLETAPAHEAAYLAAELRRRKLPLGAIIVNRVLPESIGDDAAADSASTLLELSDDEAFVAEVAARIEAEPDVTAAVLREVATRFSDMALVATREAERRAELASLTTCLLAAPSLDGEVNDVHGLAQLAGHLRDQSHQADF